MSIVTMYWICGFLVTAIVGTVLYYQRKLDGVDILKQNYEDSIKTIKDYLKEQKTLSVGKAAIIRDYRLEVTSTKEAFGVDYEVIIIDTSPTEVKVQVTDISSIDKYPREAQNKQAIMDFLNNTWVSKSQVTPIIGRKKLRNKKIDQILDKHEKENT